MTTKTYNKPPRHIAIVMDGNGRWAKAHHRPRVSGHKSGVDAIKQVLRVCTQDKIEVVTLFAFSTENWQRPKEEVSELMSLFLMVLKREVKTLHEQNVQLKIIGDISKFSTELQQHIIAAQELTKENSGLKLRIAANYGGRWDMTQAIAKIAQKIESGHLKASQIKEQSIGSELSTAGLPEPDLLIRTGGERRVSNFLLWQLAYSELVFTDTLWPDFKEQEFRDIIQQYMTRQRRFGKTEQQVEALSEQAEAK